MTDERPKQCFFIAPIGDEGTDIRERSDKILDHLIRPAVEPYGYTALRADEIDRPGIITSQVIQAIVDSDLVIADLTNHNPNVFYELAIRHVIRKPFIHIIENDQEIPFDVSVQRAIQIDLKDFATANVARKAIESQIQSLEDDPSNTDNPISLALDLQRALRTEGSEQRLFATLLPAITDLRERYASVERVIEQSRHSSSVLNDQFSDLRSAIERSYTYGGRKLDRESRSQEVFDLMRIIETSSLDPSHEYLAITGSVKADLPWFYEIAMDALRKHDSRDSKGVIRASRVLRELTSRSHIIRLMSEELHPVFFDLIQRLPALYDRMISDYEEERYIHDEN